MNWNDGSEDYNKIWRLRREVAALKERIASLEAEAARYKELLARMAEMEATR